MLYNQLKTLSRDLVLHFVPCSIEYVRVQKLALFARSIWGPRPLYA